MSKCKWKDEEELWETECGRAHCFSADGIAENGYVYCPYCGKEIMEEPRQPEILTADQLRTKAFNVQGVENFQGESKWKRLTSRFMHCV